MNMKSLIATNRYAIATAIVCSIGVALSAYAFYVETRAESEPTFKAMCDISQHMSCTKVFKSKYGKGFGLVDENSIFYVPNGLNGIFCYTLVGLVGFINDLRALKLQLLFCIISNLLSIYLAYLLAFVLHDFCVVCVSTYIVNILLMIITWHHFELKRDLKRSVNAKKGD